MDGDAPARGFGYARGVAPMLWMLLAIGIVELAVTHLLLALWWPLLAAIVSLLTLSGLFWFVWSVLAIPRLPVMVTDREVVMRVGHLKSVTIPRDRIADVSIDTAGVGLGPRDRAALNLALLASPNVLLRLSPPLRLRGREIAAIGHRLDDPQAFAAAFTREAQG